MDFFKDKNHLTLAITAGLIAIILTTLMFTQFKSVDEYKKADIEGLREEELKTQIASYKSKYEETIEQNEDNLNKISEYKNNVNENEKASELLDSELETSRSLLGLTNVTGKGVIITLTDSKDVQFSAQDIRYLINELKYAGAEAISINDNRVINLTDIVTINEKFIVMYGGNVRIASPYVIKAIGDQTYLMSTLNMKNSGFIDYMKVLKGNNVDIKIEESNNITIPKYNRGIEVRYMKEVE